MAKIIVFGGHGKVALRLAPVLKNNGSEVSSVFRNPDHQNAVEQGGAKAVVADVEKLGVDELAQLIADHDAVVWSAGAGGGNPERTYAVDQDAAIRAMEAAEKSGVKRFVMVSYMRSGNDTRVQPGDSFSHYATAKATADAALRETSLDWTILGPGKLTLDEPSGEIAVVDEVPEGETLTSRANVALVIAQVLADYSSIGKTINFMDGETPIAEAVANLDA